MYTKTRLLLLYVFIMVLFALNVGIEYYGTITDSIRLIK